VLNVQGENVVQGDQSTSTWELWCVDKTKETNRRSTSNSPQQDYDSGSQQRQTTNWTGFTDVSCFRKFTHFTFTSISRMTVHHLVCYCLTLSTGTRCWCSVGVNCSTNCLVHHDRTQSAEHVTHCYHCRGISWRCSSCHRDCRRLRRSTTLSQVTVCLFILLSLLSVP